jgi:hypothetical protein
LLAKGGYGVTADGGLVMFLGIQWSSAGSERNTDQFDDPVCVPCLTLDAAVRAERENDSQVCSSLCVVSLKTWVKKEEPAASIPVRSPSFQSCMSGMARASRMNGRMLDGTEAARSQSQDSHKLSTAAKQVASWWMGFSEE